ncbi:hypothetical protein [Pseudonocardia alni]|uniref:Uncharacterized protein n=1 Tax=Pseudonocardia alni TaxID=33907 RepID=A0A852W498_PSEA5|nr:hypothetical protein [Pseudonocardia antarctica]NYG00372.1 hypothetical protein [Pseudonocardia antarctica]
MSAPGLPRLTDPAARVRAALGPQPVADVRGRRVHRLADALTWTVADDGTVAGVRPDALHAAPRPLDALLVRTLLADLRVLDPDEAAPTAEQVDALVDDVRREVLARQTRHPRTAPVLALDRAVATRILRARRAWLDGTGQLVWRPRLADPVRGGSGEQAPVPDPVRGPDSGSVEARAGARPGTPVTTSDVADILRTGGVVQASEPRPDPGAVLVELRALAAREQVPADAGPPRPWWRRRD